MTTFATTLGQVESLYVGYFGRAGDPPGVTYWTGQLQAGAVTLAQAAASFAVQPEATTKYPYLANPSTGDPGVFVDQVYQNLFAHVADPLGKDYWVNQLKASGGNPQAVGQFILNVIAGARGADDTAVVNKVEVARDFTSKAGAPWDAITQAQSILEIAAVSSPANTVSTAKIETDVYFATPRDLQFNFTLLNDSLATAGARANFNAPVYLNASGSTLLQSLQAGDSAIDTAPGGTFTAVLLSGANTGSITLQGIPAATITSLAAGSGFNGSITGITTLTNTSSTGSLTLGLGGNGLATALGTVNITGSGVGGGPNTQAIIAASALSGSADVVTLKITGAIGTATPHTGAAQVVMMTDGAAGTATAPMNAYEAEIINASGPSYLQLSNDASGALSTTNLILQGAGAQQLSAAAGSDFANLGRIDASSTTGGVTITGALDADAAGNPFIAGAHGLVSNDTRLFSFAGGSGDDRLDIYLMTPAQVAAFTTLSGGPGRDALGLGVPVLTSGGTVPSTGFEIVDAPFQLSGAVDISRLGTSVDTLELLGAQAGAVTIANAPGTFTLQLNGYAQFNGYQIQGPAGASDVLNIFDRGSLGATVVSGFETINVTAARQENIFSLAATPSAGSAVTLNIVDSVPAGGPAFDVQLGGINVQPNGALNISGTGTGGVSMVQVTAGTLNASGLNVGADPGVRGIGMASGATSAISIVGSNGSDFLVGSPVADSIAGGAGNDLLAGTLTPAVSAGDVLTGGSGSDAFFLSGSVASSVLATLYQAVPAIADFRVGASTDDLLMLAPAGSWYGIANLQAVTTNPGPVPFQVVGSAGSTAILNAANEMVKLSQGVATTGATLQQAFNAAIGSATITGATANGSYLFMMHDDTNARTVIGIVTATNGSNTFIEAGDTVVLVGSAFMSGDDYTRFTASQIIFDLPH